MSKDVTFTNNEAIEALHNNLKSIVLQDINDWINLHGSWGWRTGKIFAERKLQFIKLIRKVAQGCYLKFFEAKFYTYNGICYEPIDDCVIKQAYNFLLEEMQIHTMVGDAKMFNEFFLDTIRVYNHLCPKFDTICFQNGVLDMRDFSFHKHSPDYHCTYYHKYNYDKTATCPMWQSFLHDVLPDRPSRVILQMFLGLGLIERATVYNSDHGDHSAVELCLMLVGTGSNGKSVIYNTAMGVFGRHRISGADYNELTGLGDEGMRARRLLRGCLFNWSSDCDVKQFGKRTGVFKKIVSGEPVTDRGIGEDVKENDIMPYLVFNINELPKATDASLGFIRRLQYISFDKIIPPSMQNKSLSFDLMNEYSGIFNWIVRGCKELKRRKFLFPDSEGSKRQLLKTILSSNPVYAWISAYCIRPEAIVRGELSVWVSSANLMKSANAFSKLNGGDEISGQMFGSIMRQQGFTKKRKCDTVYYEIFGASVKELANEFNIDLDPLRVIYTEDEDSFISEED